MIEITNKTKGPIQLIIKSKDKLRSFETLIIPGLGKNKNKKVIADELYTEYIGRARQNGLISFRVLNK